MKIAILGCGYVGSAIARPWQRNGHQVTVTTTTEQKVTQLSEISHQVVILDGKDSSAIEDLIQDQDVVLFSVGAKTRELDIYRQTYLGTAQNLVTALQNNQTVKQVIYTGSYGILGDKQGAWTDETAPVAPANENGKVLVQTEEVILSASAPSRKVCVLRLAGIYGPGRELIKIFRRSAGTTRPGAGTDYSNWVHLEDIVNGIELARLKQLAGIYNLNSDEILETRVFFRRLFTAYNLPDFNWDTNAASNRSYNLKLSNQKIKDAGLNLTHPQIVFDL
ncbi:nucleoside-diphosphate-sugar epimerase [Xenococcus sp. PCC 7305]|uniref:NAD-dependent epimerase/dehydratase family protein n=1 Tax=Xenococcus sp. PCC 7305 TaxID=102125 RepID=UPI0002ABB296|nr:NAD-dependent epimerase/dehydratase family protein [Xenococcus sp. PCC 7305]ELS05179.1 nucleoside-diphosphate-sugar epimerase [Xenococcus sp. PCC 7305]